MLSVSNIVPVTPHKEHAAIKLDLTAECMAVFITNTNIGEHLQAIMAENARQ